MIAIPDDEKVLSASNYCCSVLVAEWIWHKNIKSKPIEIEIEL